LGEQSVEKTLRGAQTSPDLDELQTAKSPTECPPGTCLKRIRRKVAHGPLRHSQDTCQCSAGTARALAKSKCLVQSFGRKSGSFWGERTVVRPLPQPAGFAGSNQPGF